MPPTGSGGARSSWAFQLLADFLRRRRLAGSVRLRRTRRLSCSRRGPNARLERRRRRLRGHRRAAASATVADRAVAVRRSARRRHRRRDTGEPTRALGAGGRPREGRGPGDRAWISPSVLREDSGPRDPHDPRRRHVRRPVGSGGGSRPNLKGERPGLFVSIHANSFPEQTLHAGLRDLLPVGGPHRARAPGGGDRERAAPSRVNRMDPDAGAGPRTSSCGR